MLAPIVQEDGIDAVAEWIAHPGRDKYVFVTVRVQVGDADAPGPVGFGADLVMDCSGHPSAGPEGIEFLRDGGTYVEMGQFTDAGAIATSWHRICAKDINVLGSWGFTGNDLPLGVDMLYRGQSKYPWFDMQTLYPFSEDGIARAVADAMAMKTVKSTIVPFPELINGPNSSSEIPA